MEPMKIIEVDINSLIPYVNNSKTHPEEQISMIAASISEFGFNNPILVDDKSGIIAGHGRLAAAKKLNLKTVPTINLSHLTEVQKKAYILADNRLGEVGGSSWDYELVSLELESLMDSDFDIDLVGFDDSFVIVEENEGLTDEDAVPEVTEDTITVIGDLWILGNHRLLCGDSTSVDAVERLMDGQKAELLFTSPPYSDMRDYNGGKDLSVSNLVDFIQTFYPFVEYQVVNLGIQRKDNEIFQYWDEYIEKAKNIGYKFLSWNVWDQIFNGGIGKATAIFRIEHEWIFVFGKTRKDMNKTVLNKNAGDLHTHRSDRQKDGSVKKKKVDIIEDKRGLGTVSRIYPQLARNVDTSHPAMFPIELPEEYICAITDIKDIVVEPFAGSGTTLIASEKVNRICFAMELDPKYCDVIIKRWQEYTGNEATHEDGRTFNEVLNASV